MVFKSQTGQTPTAHSSDTCADGDGSILGSREPRRRDRSRVDGRGGGGGNRLIVTRLPLKDLDSVVGHGGSNGSK